MSRSWLCYSCCQVLSVLWKEGRRRLSPAYLGSVLVLPTSPPPRLSSPWEQLQWPEEAQAVGGKVTSISKKPEEAPKSGKRDVREQQGSGVPSCPAPPLLTASTQVVGRCRRWSPRQAVFYLGRADPQSWAEKDLVREGHLPRDISYSISLWVLGSDFEVTSAMSMYLDQRSPEIPSSWSCSVTCLLFHLIFDYENRVLRLNQSLCLKLPSNHTPFFFFFPWSYSQREYT